MNIGEIVKSLIALGVPFLRNGFLFAGGRPAVSSRPLGRGNTPIATTNTTSEETMASVTVPGGVTKVNGGIRVNVWSSTTGANTGNRDVFIRYGGQLLGEGRVAAAATPSAAGMSQWEIWNTSETSQIGQHATSSSFSAIATTPAFKTANVNSAADQLLEIRFKKSVGTDDFTLLRWSVEVLPPLA